MKQDAHRKDSSRFVAANDASGLGFKLIVGRGFILSILPTPPTFCFEATEITTGGCYLFVVKNRKSFSDP